MLYGSQSIEKDKGVLWSLKELETLLCKCEKWLIENKSKLVQHDYGDSFIKSQREELLSEFKDHTDILSNIFGYRKQDLTPDIKKRIKTIVKDLESYSVPVLKVKVVFGLFRNYKKYINEVQTALINPNNREFVVDALESVKIAIYNSPYHSNRKFQEELLKIIRIPLEWRLMEIMSDIFDTLSYLITLDHFDLTSIIDSINSSLQYVLDINTESNNISLEEYLELKYHSISLAAALYRKYEKANNQIPGSILNWKKVAEDAEEFADVRNGWYRSYK